MNPPEQFRIVALLAAGGLIGAFIVGRHARGLRGALGCLLWLSLPFAVIAFILAVQFGPNIALRQDRDLDRSLVLISLTIGSSWLPASLLGALLGLWFRKPLPAPVSPPAWVDPLADMGLPDWTRPDDPRLSLAELAAMLQGAAELAGSDPRCLPHVGPPPGGDGEYIDINGSGYLYAALQRGEVAFAHRSACADELAYRVFVDQAHRLAAERLAGRFPSRHAPADDQKADAEHAAQMAAEQQSILDDVDAAWGRQFAHERAGCAGG